MPFVLGALFFSPLPPHPSFSSFSSMLNTEKKESSRKRFNNFWGEMKMWQKRKSTEREGKREENENNQYWTEENIQRIVWNFSRFNCCWSFFFCLMKNELWRRQMVRRRRGKRNSWKLFDCKVMNWKIYLTNFWVFYASFSREERKFNRKKKFFFVKGNLWDFLG